MGLGESGSMSMPGSDIVICANHNGVVSAGDYYATAFEAPLHDGIQDWSLVSTALNATHMQCILSRALDTGDIYADHPIVNNEHRTKLVFAHGTVMGNRPSTAW